MEDWRIHLKGALTPREANAILEWSGIKITIRSYIFGGLLILALVGQLAIYHADRTEKFIKDHGLVVGYERQYMPPVDSVWFWAIALLLMAGPLAMFLSYKRAKRRVQGFRNEYRTPVNLTVSKGSVKWETAHSVHELKWDFFTGSAKVEGVTLLLNQNGVAVFWSDLWMRNPGEAAALDLLLDENMLGQKPKAGQP